MKLGSTADEGLRWGRVTTGDGPSSFPPIAVANDREKIVMVDP